MSSRGDGRGTSRRGVGRAPGSPSQRRSARIRQVVAAVIGRCRSVRPLAWHADARPAAREMRKDQVPGDCTIGSTWCPTLLPQSAQALSRRTDGSTTSRGPASRAWTSCGWRSESPVPVATRSAPPDIVPGRETRTAGVRSSRCPRRRLRRLVEDRNRARQEDRKHADHDQPDEYDCVHNLGGAGAGVSERVCARHLPSDRTFRVGRQVSLLRT